MPSLIADLGAGKFGTMFLSQAGRLHGLHVAGVQHVAERPGLHLDHSASAVYPGALIFLTVLCFNFVGDGLRDALDPRQRL